jgi:PAS domain S-box-containing protein
LKKNPIASAWPHSDGKMAALIRAHPWHRTPLGPIGTWPLTLRTAVELTLASPIAAILLWGPEHIQIYNDLWIEIHPSRHPAALGQPTHECFRELVDVLDPVYKQAQQGKGVVLDDTLLPVLRNGIVEDAWWNVVYTPIRGESGAVEGIFCTLTETTAKVLAECARAETETARRTDEERQAFLLKLSDTLRPMTDPVEVQKAAVRLLAEQLDVMRVTYFEVDPDQDGFKLTARYERNPAPIPDRMRLSDFAPEMSNAYRAGHTLIFRDTEIDTQLGSRPEAYRPLSIRAWAAVPLVKANQLVAIVGVHSRVPRDWTEAQVQLLEDVAERTWAEAERARAETALRESEGRLALELADTRQLHRISSSLIVEDNVDALYNAILDVARSLMRSEMASIQRLVPEQQQLSLLAQHGFAHESAKFWERVSADSTSSFGLTLAHGNPVIVSDVETWGFVAGTEDLKHYRLSGIRAMLSSPLVSRDGRLVGVMSTYWRDVHQPSERELSLLDVLARQAADLIERNAATAALGESERRLALAFKTLPIGIALIDADGETVMANDEMRRFLPTGVIPSRDPAHVSRWLGLDADGRIVPPKQFPGARALRGEVVSPGLQMVYRNHEGRETWTEVLSAPLLEESGKVTGALTVVIDVDRIKRSEEAARASEQRLRLALTVGELATWDWNIITGAVVWSDEHYTMQGFAVGEVEPSYDHWLARVHPEDRIGAVSAIENARENRTIYSHSFRSLHPDGTIRHCSARGHFFYDERGNAVRMIGVMRDVTHQWMAQERLRESEQRFRALVTAGTYSIYRMSPDWKLMYQLDSESLANTSGPIENWPDKYIFAEDCPTVFAAIEYAIRTKSLFELEHRIRLADGSIGWVLSRAVPLLDCNGDIYEWFGAGSDVTTRRVATEKLRESEKNYRIQLEQQVQDRTAELEKSRDLLQATMDSSIDMIQVFEAIRNEHNQIVDFRWLLNNHASETRYGDVQGQSLLERNPGVVQEGIFDAFRRVVETGESDVAERHYVHEQFNGWFFQSAVKLDDGVATTTKDITAWKEAQEEVLRLLDEVAQAKLRESEEKYRTLFESIDEGFALIEVIYNPAGEAVNYRFLEVNSAFGQHTGLQNVVGQLGSVLGPNTEADWLTAYAEVARTGEPVRFEKYHYDTQRWYQVYVSRVGGPDRHQVALVFDNITERKENELRQAFLLRLSDAVRPLADPVDIMATVSEIVGRHFDVGRCGYAEVPPPHERLFVARDWTNGIMQSLGGSWPIASFGGPLLEQYRSGKTVVFGDILNDDRFHGYEAGSVAAGRVRSSIAAQLMKDGQWVATFYVQDTAARHWTPGEVVLIEEIAERTWAAVERARAEQALRDSEERFRLLVDNVQEYALFQTDADGKVTSWNPGAERLFGYSTGEMMGQSAQLLFTPDDQRIGVLENELRQARVGQRSEDARWMMRRDGGRFWAQWITELVRDENGRLRGVAKVLRDETDRQRADQAIRGSLAEKEGLLKEVHHRVKNNLQVIISLLNMQASQISDERILSLFQETRNRVLAISSIHELLYRAESFANISLSDYARQIVPGLVQFYGLEKRVQAEIVGEGATLELERAVPYGMLLNELVSNACKHAFLTSQTGTLLVEIKPEGDDIQMTVADTGPGFPEGFDYRKTTSLGLRLVHGLVRQLGGSIKIQSGPSTTITVRFPATRIDTED